MASVKIRAGTVVGIGVVGLLLTVVGSWPRYGTPNWWAPEFLTLLVFILSAGIIATGVQWLRSGTTTPLSDTRIPQVTLMILAAVTVVGAPLVFRPWEKYGLAGGVARFLMAVFVLMGCIVGLTGLHWYRLRERRLSLAALIGLLVLIGTFAFFRGLLPPSLQDTLLDAAVILAVITVWGVLRRLLPKDNYNL